MFREAVFKWELVRKQALLAGDLTAVRAAQDQMAEAFQATGMLLSPGAIPQYIEPAHLGSEMIRQIAGTDQAMLEDPVITDDDFAELKAFVGKLLDVNLSRTTLKRVPAKFLAEWTTSHELAEATAISCGIDEHLILLPESSFQSYDLVVHELGHAAEFTLRRQLNTDWGLVNRPIISEATAHYAQFSHLLACGTPMRRQGALGAFLHPYLVAQYIFTADRGTRTVRDALQTERFSAFREAGCYSLARLEELLLPFEKRPPIETYCDPVEKRFSIPLALKLRDRPACMRKLAAANFHTSLDNVLRELELDPNELLNFTHLDSLFAAFVGDIVKAT